MQELGGLSAGSLFSVRQQTPDITETTVDEWKIYVENIYVFVDYFILFVDNMRLSG